MGPSGIPHAVIADGHRREVIAINEDWLVQDRWWTDDPVDRHYYELVVEPGRVIVTFHDTRAGAWFHHDAQRLTSRREPPSHGTSTMGV